jgi:hypothetical protein
MSEAKIYRQRAADCERLADEAISKEVKETLREVAKKYVALATNEERSNRRPPIVRAASRK